MVASVDSFPLWTGSGAWGTYVLPLSNGAVLPLDIRTGRVAGLAMPHDDWHVGTLVAGGDVIVSVTPGSLRAWSQAHAAADGVRTAEGTDPIHAAEVHLALGSNFAAKDALRGVLQDTPSHPSATSARDILREILFSELEGQTGPQKLLLDELGEFAQAPEHRGRYLVHKALHERDSGDSAGLFNSIEELLALSNREPLVPRQDPSRAIAPDAWVRGLLARNEDAPFDEGSSGVPSNGDAVERELAEGVAADLRRAIATGDERRLRHLTLMHVYPQASRLAGLALARSLAARGRSQEAEVRFIGCRQSDDETIAALATRDLAELWTNVACTTKRRCCGTTSPPGMPMSKWHGA